MEDLLLLILQGLLELLFEVLAYLPFDEMVSLKTSGGSRRSHLFLLFLTGCLIGGLSLLVRPHTVLASAWLRIGNLVLAPVTSGYLARALGRWRRRRNPIAPLTDGYWQGFWFTLGLVLVRFVGAARF